MDTALETDHHKNDEDVANDHIETHENEDEEEEEDFTFVFIGEEDDNSSPIYLDKSFEEGQMFPLFDQKLLLEDGVEYEFEQVTDHHHQDLPFQPPVNKVFTEVPNEELTAEGPFCEWSKDQHNQQLSKKSNSTGFSKLWRLREKVHRSNSDGRDAFVFLKSSDKTTSSSSSSNSKPVSGDNHGTIKSTFVKVNNGNNETRRAKVVKKTTISPHEAYMRSKGGHNERKTYLPYRPELMGFFTNVNGGLSKNVHPY